MTPGARLWHWFTPLTRKALRELAENWSQALAVALVMAAGVSFFIVMNGVYHSLEVTRDTYYERYRFAEGWAPVKRAPDAILADAQAIPGISRIEARIVANGILDMPDMAEPVTAHLISLPDKGEPMFSRVHLVAGRKLNPGAPDEVIVTRDFANEHGLKPGDQLTANLYGIRRHLTIVGIGLSPEVVYSVPPGEMAPNPRSYGVMWMSQKALSHIYNLHGAFNELHFSFVSGVNHKGVTDALDRLLDRYGATGAYDRMDHISDSFIRSEFHQIKTVGQIIPPIFLMVSAFILYIVVTRSVEQDRSQIGLMKAFGYHRWQIGFAYAKGPAIIVAFAVLLGWIGGNWMGRGLSGIYANFYSFPVFIFDAGGWTYVEAIGLAILTGLAGVFFAVKKTLELAPAVAMSPAPPTDYGDLSLFKGYRGRFLDQGSRLILRHLLRWPVRAVATGFGIALGVSILVSARGIHDSLDKIIETVFVINNRSDATVTFNEPQGETILPEMARLPGVLYAEPFRVAGATLSFGSRSINQPITGILDDATLDRLTDLKERTIAAPPSGIVLSDFLAKELGVKAGDVIHVRFREGRHKEVDVRVARVVTALIGTPAHMRLDNLNAMMLDGVRFTGVNLRLDTNEADKLYRMLKDRPVVAGLTVKARSKAQLEQILDQFLGTIILVNTGFAAMIAVGVVYSSARVSFAEREREIASLRVLGFTRAEVNYVLLGELGLITLLSMPFGVWMGIGINQFLTQNLASKIFRVPAAITDQTMAVAVAVILIAAALSAAAVMGKVRNLDLVSALKARE